MSTRLSTSDSSEPALQGVHPVDAGSEAQDLPPSSRLQIIGKMKDTLAGRVMGTLMADGSDPTAVEALMTAAKEAGMSVKLIAPKVGAAKLADGVLLAVDGQLAGMPSVMFDAVAILLSEDGAKRLSTESAAIDFVRDAFGHIKALAVDRGGQVLIQAAGIRPDTGVVAADDVDAFLTAAKTRQWERERTVRTLA